MTHLPVRRQPRSLFPEFSELFAAFPSFAGLRPIGFGRGWICAGQPHTPNTDQRGSIPRNAWHVVVVQPRTHARRMF